MSLIRLNASVDNSSEVGQTVVLESCRQVREHHGELAALEVATGALSAAVAMILLTLDEKAAKKAVLAALKAGLEAIVERTREGMH